MPCCVYEIESADTKVEAPNSNAQTPQQPCFKIISLTVVFGLYHGLVFLLVMLILFGSDDTEQKESSEENTENTDNSEEYNNVTKGKDNPVFREVEFVRSI